MAFTGSYNVDKYILPSFLDIKTVAILLNSSGYFKNLIYNCKKIMKNDFKCISPCNGLLKLCENDNYKCLALLIKCGIDINGIDYCGVALQGWTLLHYACLYQYYKCAKLLIKYGANVNAKMRYTSSSPLIIACHHVPNNNIIELLLEHNADTNIVDITGRNALDRLYGKLPYANGIEKYMINDCIFMINEKSSHY
jgi:hypothetical protein